MKNFFSSLLLLAVLPLRLSLQAQIPAHYYGVNSWMPEYVGESTSPCGGVNVPGFPYYPDGKFYPILNNSTLIQASGLTLLRYGGTTADLNGPTWGSSTAQWDEFILAAQGMGAEPVIQIPFLKQFYCDNTSSPTWNTATSASNAIANYVTSLVTYIMSTHPGVKYYSIGNEPDRYDEVIGSPALSAVDIANYFKPISEEIKTIYANAGKPVPFVIGPDLAEAQLSSLMPGLIDPLGGSGDITGQITSMSGTHYYCDIYTYHTYPFDGTQSRTFVINHPSGSYFSDLGAIRQRISALGALQNQNLEIGLTEFNINWQNPTANQAADLAANSFIAGQWMADMFATGLRPPAVLSENAPVAIMTPWSVHENSGSGLTYDLGLLNGPYVSPTSLPTGRSTYYHLQLMANHFTGPATTFLENTYNGSPPNDSEIKAYAYINSGSNETGVLIMNQKSTGGPHSVEINFDGTTNPASGYHRIRIAGGNTATYTCQIETEATALLKFTSTTGALISRTDYRLEDAEKLVGPRTWTPNSAAYIPGAYIQDSPHDAGNQGNVETNTAQPGVFWASTDIWNRYPSADGVSNQVHQNPQNTPGCSGPNYLYVKIRNNSCQAITAGTLNVYYANAGTGITWGPVNQWSGYSCATGDAACSPSLVCGDQIANVTGITVPANSEVIEQITWCPPDPSDYSYANSNCGPAITGQSAHFCLLAHFDAPADPLPYLNVPAYYNVWDQAYLLNNVAWKNVEIIDNDGSSIAPTGVVWIRNVKESNFIRLRFLSRKDKNGETVLDYAKVRLHFTRQFIRNWKKGGQRGEGIVLVNDSVVEITNTNAQMDQVFMKYMETQAVAMQLIPVKSYPRNLNEFFSFDIEQSNLDDPTGKPSGGQRYDIKKNRWKVRNKGWWKVWNCFTSAMRKLIPKCK